MTALDVLRRGVVNMCASTGVPDWLTPSLARATTCSTTELLQLYTQASRRVPAARFASEPSADTFVQWTCVDAARAALLLARAEASTPAALVDAAVACYENGDAGEQRSWLRAVALLPDSQRFLAVVVDACRTNILPNFEAVACENPYPSRHFPEHNFNQLVLKALFNNIRLSRIVGLAGRANGELARMAGDYASERRAAGRAIPIDIGLALAGATPQGTTV
jgi:hypothetical protein